MDKGWMAYLTIKIVPVVHDIRSISNAPIANPIYSSIIACGTTMYTKTPYIVNISPIVN